MSFLSSSQPIQNEINEESEEESINCNNDVQVEESSPASLLATTTTTSENIQSPSEEESKENDENPTTMECENVPCVNNQSIIQSAPIPIISSGSLLTNSFEESLLFNQEYDKLDHVNLQIMENSSPDLGGVVNNVVGFQPCDQDDKILFNKITNESSATINNYKNKSKNEIKRSSIQQPAATIGQNYSPFFESSERTPVIMESSIYDGNNSTSNRSLTTTTNYKQRNIGFGFNEFNNDEVIRNRRLINRGIIDYDGGDEADLNESTTWPCSICTFFNSLNSYKCIQCDTPRRSQFIQDHLPSAIKFHSGSDIEEIDKRLNPLKIVDLEKKSGDKMTSSYNMNINRAINSRTNVPANTIRTSASHVGSNCDKPFKWPCPLCTYENFEKSLKCVMCLTQKPDDFITRRNPDQQLFEPSLVNNSFSTIDNRRNYKHETQTGSPLSLSLTIENENNEENNLRNLRRRKERELDERWLDACRGVVDGDYNSVELYLLEGGSPARALTENEIKILNRPSAFDEVGITLIHLALRFHQENMLAVLLSAVDQGTTQSGKKLVPSYAAPDIADRICRTFVSSIRQRKGPFRCNFTCEDVIFTLPSEIEDLSPDIQETLFDEILDREVQKELENSHIINWCAELTDQLNSRLYALWNRTSGDCLLDSVLGAIWGIFDRKNDLRNLLADSLHDCSSMFYQRWKENELCHARLYNFSLNDNNLMTDWSKLLSIASQPGQSLEQLHIFALAHIIRRPIIVYGVKYVKSFRGENLGYAKYEGVYLPLLWEPSFCFKSPITIAYTRGHFSALVPMETDCDPLRASSNLDAAEEAIYLPIISSDGSLLPVHFLCQSEGKEEKIMSQWLDLCFTETGIMVARQTITKRPPLLSQMLEEWLTHYRGFSQISSNRTYTRPTKTCYISSDGESD